MFCALCGSENPDGASRCRVCQGPLMPGQGVMPARAPSVRAPAPAPVAVSTDGNTAEVFAVPAPVRTTAPPPPSAGAPQRPSILVPRAPTPMQAPAVPRPVVAIQPPGQGTPVVKPVEAALNPALRTSSVPAPASLPPRPAVAAPAARTAPVVPAVVPPPAARPPVTAPPPAPRQTQQMPGVPAAPARVVPAPAPPQAPVPAAPVQPRLPPPAAVSPSLFTDDTEPFVAPLPVRAPVAPAPAKPVLPSPPAAFSDVTEPFVPPPSPMERHTAKSAVALPPVAPAQPPPPPPPTLPPPAEPVTVAEVKPEPAPVVSVAAPVVLDAAAAPVVAQEAFRSLAEELEPEMLPQPKVARAASWVQKLAAALVDAAVCFALTLGYAVVEALDLPSDTAVSTQPLGGVDWVIDVLARYSGFLLGMMVAQAVAVLFYEGLSVAVMGRTAGQKVMGLRLLRASDGDRPGMRLGMVRGLLAGLGLLVVGAGWLWAPFDRRRNALHDKWTGLVLVEDGAAPVRDSVPPSTDPGLPEEPAAPAV